MAVGKKPFLKACVVHRAGAYGANPLKNLVWRPGWLQPEKSRRRNQPRSIQARPARNEHTVVLCDKVRYVATHLHG